MDTKIKIMDAVAAGLTGGTKIVFDFPVTAAEIAEALDGKVWTSKDGKLTNVYLKVRSGYVDKVWLYKKDDATYYFSSVKNTYPTALLSEARAWRFYLENRSSVLAGLAIVEQTEKAEEAAREARSAQPLPPAAEAVVRKIANGVAVAESELVAAGFDYVGSRDGMLRYEAPVWFAGVKDLILYFKDGLVAEYDATAAEMEKIAAFLARYANPTPPEPPSGGDETADAPAAEYPAQNASPSASEGDAAPGLEKLFGRAASAASQTRTEKIEAAQAVVLELAQNLLQGRNEARLDADEDAVAELLGGKVWRNVRKKFVRIYFPVGEGEQGYLAFNDFVGQKRGWWLGQQKTVFEKSKAAVVAAALKIGDRFTEAASAAPHPPQRSFYPRPDFLVREIFDYPELLDYVNRAYDVEDENEQTKATLETMRRNGGAASPDDIVHLVEKACGGIKKLQEHIEKTVWKRYRQTFEGSDFDLTDEQAETICIHWTMEKGEHFNKFSVLKLDLAARWAEAKKYGVIR